MARRTRLFLLIAAGVLVGGLGTGLVASYMGLQSLTILGADGPADLAYVPQDARLVGFVNVRGVMDSEFRQKFRELHPDAGPTGALETQTGINIDTDVDQVVLAALNNGGDGQHPLMIARGRFDEVRIEGLVREKGGQVQDFQGKRLLVLQGDEPMAMTFAEPGLVLAGAVSAVQAALTTKGGAANVTDNAELMTLIRDVETETAWAVGRFDVISNNGRIPPAVVDQLPPINLFSASGHVNGGLRATVRAEARDDAAAQNLRDVVRGFVALARLQAGRQEQLLTLLDSVQLAGDGKTVALSVTIPVDALNLLSPPAPRQQAAARLR